MIRKIKSKKPKLTVVMVSYKDHHWFDDDLTSDEIKACDVNGEQSIILTDIGILMKETKDYYVVSSHREARNIPLTKNPDQNMTRKSVYSSTSRILKCSVIAVHRWSV